MEVNFTSRSSSCNGEIGSDIRNRGNSSYKCTEDKETIYNGKKINWSVVGV